MCQGYELQPLKVTHDTICQNRLLLNRFKLSSTVLRADDSSNCGFKQEATGALNNGLRERGVELATISTNLKRCIYPA